MSPQVRSLLSRGASPRYVVDLGMGWGSWCAGVRPPAASPGFQACLLYTSSASFPSMITFPLRVVRHALFLYSYGNSRWTLWWPLFVFRIGWSTGQGHSRLAREANPMHVPWPPSRYSWLRKPQKKTVVAPSKPRKAGLCAHRSTGQGHFRLARDANNPMRRVPWWPPQGYSEN